MFSIFYNYTVRKYFAAFITILYFVLPSNAQHCEWDNLALLAVRPMYKGKMVEGLKIELISTDNPHSTKIESHKNGLFTIYNDATKLCTKRNKIDRIKKAAFFDFVQNDYVVLTGNEFREGLFIRITDVRDDLNQPKIGTQIIPVTREHLLALCGIREGSKSFDSLYNPMVVLLSTDEMMNQYRYHLPTKTKPSVTFYTAPMVYKDDYVIVQIIQTGVSANDTRQIIEHEFFKIHPYQFAIQHFDSLKNISVDEQGMVLDFVPQRKSIDTTSSNLTIEKAKDTLPQKIRTKKIDEPKDEKPSLKAFIVNKLAKGNEGMVRYYLKKNVEQFNSANLHEYLDTYKEIDTAKLEFDLDKDRDMDYCTVYRNPKPHIDFYIFDNVLREFVLDTLMSKAPYLDLNVIEHKLMIADYPRQQMDKTNIVQTYKRWNGYWQLIEWELQDYLTPHNNVNEARRKRLNDTLVTYDARTKHYIQHADYNFDGNMDTRIAYDSHVVFHNTSYYCEQFDYYIYDKEKGKAIKDEFLSSGTFTFDFINQTAIGYVEKRSYTKEKIWRSISNKYVWMDHKFVKTEIVEQIQSCPNCEQTITIRSKIINGKWQQVEYDPGAE